MNHQDSRSVTTAGKIFSPTALALAVALALGCWNSAALAASNPIPGIDIIVKKKPGPSYPISVPTNKDGTYKFTGLAAGKYDLSVGGQRVQTITVGANRSISGVLSRGSDGAASLSVNGQTGPVLVGPPGAAINTTRSNIKKPGIAAGEEPLPEGPAGAAINTTRSNIKRPGIVKGEEPPPADVLPGAPVNTSRSNKKTGGIAPSRDGGGVLGEVATTRGVATPPGGGDGAASQAKDDVNGAFGQVSTTRGVATPPGGGDEELPGKHNYKGIVTLVRGMAPRTDGGDGKAGISDQAAAGGLTSYSTAAPPKAPDVNATKDEVNSAFNTVSTTRGVATPPGGGDGKAGISDQAAAGGLTSYGTAPPPKGEGEELPGLAGQPIPGVDVKLGKNPGGSIAVVQTGSDGAFHFDKLPAGKYKLTIRGEPPISVSVVGDGIAGGKVMRGPDGSMSVFDRWGNSLTAPQPKAGDVKQAPPDQTAGSKAAESPVGFGSGNNAMGAGPGAGLGAAGMSPPGAAMGGAGPMSPMSPGAGPMGPGGPMGGAMRH